MNGLLAAILGGIGQGVGGAAQGVQQAREQERQKQRDALLERQVSLAEAQAYEDPSTYAPLFKALGLPDPSANIVGPQRMRAGTTMAMLPMLAAEAKEKRALAREQADRQGVARVLREAAGTPPTQAPAAPDVPVADGMETLFNILMPGRAPLSRHEAGARLAEYGKEGLAALDKVYPADSYVGVPLDHDLVNKNTAEVVRPGTPKVKEPDSGQRNEARAAAILRQRGIPEGSRAWNEGMYILTNPTPTVPDVGVFSRLDVLDRLPSQDRPPAPSASASTSEPIAPSARIPAPPKPPQAGERERIATLNSMIPVVDRLIKQWDADPDAKPSAIRQLSEREMAFGIKLADLGIGGTTSAQKTFMAEAGQVVADYRTLKQGLNVTQSEALRSMPTIPDDPAALTREQLVALRRWMNDNRAEIDRALVAARHMPGPKPQVTPSQGPSSTPSPARNNDPLGIRTPQPRGQGVRG